MLFLVYLATKPPHAAIDKNFLSGPHIIAPQVSFAVFIVPDAPDIKFVVSV
jgi:hypothetical protein